MKAHAYCTFVDKQVWKLLFLNLIFLLFYVISKESGSKVKLPNIREAEGAGGGEGREKFHAKNWKALSKKEVQKLSQLERSKYTAVSISRFLIRY